MSQEALQREYMARLGHSLFSRGLTFGSSGNLSVRLADGWLITPTNSCLGELDPLTLSKLDIDGVPRSGLPPSKEWFFHKAAYDARTSIGAVVHLHGTYSVAVSCLEGLNRDDCVPALTAYFVMRIGHVPLVPYFRPGDCAVAEVVGQLLRSHNAVLLANHGPVVIGRTLEEARHNAEELEETAKLFLLLHGHQYRTLSTADIDDLRAHFPGNT